MKTVKILSMAALAAFTFASCGGGEKDKKNEKKEEGPKAVTYVIDAATSELQWHGEKNPEYGHTGTAGIKSGELTMEGDLLKAAMVEVDMNTLAEPGNADTESAGKLVGHLKDTSFFFVAAFPSATFALTSAEKQSDGTYGITGDISIKGVTKSISFPATITIEGKNLTATAEFSINRVDFGVKYGSVADGAKPEDSISDTVTFKATLKASAKE
ncbi:MAG: YceI family protein [Bacteroidota bacterium]